jgi:hypothetical protein
VVKSAALAELQLERKYFSLNFYYQPFSAANGPFKGQDKKDSELRQHRVDIPIGCELDQALAIACAECRCEPSEHEFIGFAFCLLRFDEPYDDRDWFTVTDDGTTCKADLLTLRKKNEHKATRVARDKKGATSLPPYQVRKNIEATFDTWLVKQLFFRSTEDKRHLSNTIKVTSFKRTDIKQLEREITEQLRLSLSQEINEFHLIKLRALRFRFAELEGRLQEYIAAHVDDEPVVEKVRRRHSESSSADGKEEVKERPRKAPRIGYEAAITWTDGDSDKHRKVIGVFADKEAAASELIPTFVEEQVSPCFSDADGRNEVCHRWKASEQT